MKKNFVNFCSARSEFEPIIKKLQFSRLRRTGEGYKAAIFCRDLLHHSLGEGKLYPGALHKIANQTVDFSEIFIRLNLQK